MQTYVPILHLVFEHLDNLQDVLNAARVCKQWRVAANDPTFWRAKTLALWDHLCPVEHSKPEELEVLKITREEYVRHYSVTEEWQWKEQYKHLLRFHLTRYRLVIVERDGRAFKLWNGLALRFEWKSQPYSVLLVPVPPTSGFLSPPLELSSEDVQRCCVASISLVSKFNRQLLVLTDANGYQMRCTREDLVQNEPLLIDRWLPKLGLSHHERMQRSWALKLPLGSAASFSPSPFRYSRSPVPLCWNCTQCQRRLPPGAAVYNRILCSSATCMDLNTASLPHTPALYVCEACWAASKCYKCLHISPLTALPPSLASKRKLLTSVLTISISKKVCR